MKCRWQESGQGSGQVESVFMKGSGKRRGSLWIHKGGGKEGKERGGKCLQLKCRKRERN